MHKTQRATATDFPKRRLSSWGFIIAIVVAVGLLAFVRQYAGRTAQTPEMFASAASLDQALAQSSSSGKPLFVVITADWCPPCQMYKRDALADEQVVRAVLEAAIPVYIDHDKDKDDVARLAGMGLPERFGLPTTLIVREGGITEFVQGRLSPADVVSLVKRSAG